MPTIELTDEQAEELRRAVHCAVEDLERMAKSPFSSSEDHDEYFRVRPILSDILHLLEVA